VLAAQIAGQWPDNLRHGGGRQQRFLMSFSAPQAKTDATRSESAPIAGGFMSLSRSASVKRHLSRKCIRAATVRERLSC
jgi:hypothetical protein